MGGRRPWLRWAAWRLSDADSVPIRGRPRGALGLPPTPLSWGRRVMALNAAFGRRSAFKRESASGPGRSRSRPAATRSAWSSSSARATRRPSSCGEVRESPRAWFPLGGSTCHRLPLRRHLLHHRLGPRACSAGPTPPPGEAGVPEAGDTVSIPAGKTVLLDRSTPPLAGLQVNGGLVFDDDYLTLTSDWVMVHGRLQIGSAAAPFIKRVRIELTGTDKTQNVMGMGPKLLRVMGGTLDVHGERRGGRTRLAATASKGATSLTLERNPGWRAG